MTYFIIRITIVLLSIYNLEMKTKQIFTIATYLLFAVLVLQACKKDNKPTVTLPELTTIDLTGLTIADANAGGQITNTGGKIDKFGLVWSSTNPIPEVGPGKNEGLTENLNGTLGKFTNAFSSLAGNKTYYFRAYATNGAGTAYGEIKSFVIDVDNNVYHTVKIGNQIWMLENLRTTKLNDGIQIKYSPDAASWSTAAAGAYTYYDYLPANQITYGNLYNWHIINYNKVAPIGWHIPTLLEWQALLSYLGGLGSAGSQLKESGNTHWLSANSDATNASGFTALPGGLISTSGSFVNFKLVAYFWTATQNDSETAYFTSMDSNSGKVIQNYINKLNGFSIRCIKD